MLPPCVTLKFLKDLAVVARRDLGRRIKNLPSFDCEACCEAEYAGLEEPGLPTDEGAWTPAATLVSGGEEYAYTVWQPDDTLSRHVAFLEESFKTEGDRDPERLARLEMVAWTLLTASDLPDIPKHITNQYLKDTAVTARRDLGWLLLNRLLPGYERESECANAGVDAPEVSRGFATWTGPGALANGYEYAHVSPDAEFRSLVGQLNEIETGTTAEIRLARLEFIFWSVLAESERPQFHKCVTHQFLKDMAKMARCHLGRALLSSVATACYEQEMEADNAGVDAPDFTV